MNFPKIKNILFFGIILALCAACDCIYDDLRSCPQGIAFNFHSLTPCGDELSLENMKNLNVQVYDESGKFITQFSENDITVSSGYTLFVPFSTPGTFTFAFWGMENNSGYSKPDDASLQLNADKNPVAERLPRLFYGKLEKQAFIDRSHLGTQIDTLRVNMQPYTYDIRFRVSGNIINMAQKYTLEVADKNAKYNHLGGIVPTDVSYIQPLRTSGDAMMAAFNTLKLTRGGDASVMVKKEDGTILFQETLEELIKQVEHANGTAINLECQHTLDMALHVDIKETYMRIAVTINDWNAVYRRVILGA